MCCGLEWNIGVVGVQNICKIGYNGIQLFTVLMYSRVQWETVKNNINVQCGTLIYRGTVEMI